MPGSLDQMKSVIDKLSDDRIQIEPADLQAVLWYLERELYYAFGQNKNPTPTITPVQPKQPMSSWLNERLEYLRPAGRNQPVRLSAFLSLGIGRRSLRAKHSLLPLSDRRAPIASKSFVVVPSLSWMCRASIESSRHATSPLRSSRTLLSSLFSFLYLGQANGSLRILRHARNKVKKPTITATKFRIISSMRDLSGVGERC